MILPIAICLQNEVQVVQVVIHNISNTILCFEKRYDQVHCKVKLKNLGILLHRFIH